MRLQRKSQRNLMRLATRTTSVFKSCDYLPRCCLPSCQDSLNWRNRHRDKAVVGRRNGGNLCPPHTQAWQKMKIWLWCLAMPVVGTWWQRRPLLLLLRMMMPNAMQEQGLSHQRRGEGGWSPPGARASVARVTKESRSSSSEDPTKYRHSLQASPPDRPVARVLQL